MSQTEELLKTFYDSLNDYYAIQNILNTVINAQYTAYIIAYYKSDVFKRVSGFAKIADTIFQFDMSFMTKDSKNLVVVNLRKGSNYVMFKKEIYLQLDRQNLVICYDFNPDMQNQECLGISQS